MKYFLLLLCIASFSFLSAETGPDEADYIVLLRYYIPPGKNFGWELSVFHIGNTVYFQSKGYEGKTFKVVFDDDYFSDFLNKVNNAKIWNYRSEKVNTALSPSYMVYFKNNKYERVLTLSATDDHYGLNSSFTILRRTLQNYYTFVYPGN